MKKIIDQLLESEGYVPFDSNKHNRMHFNLCRLVKDEIRSHKWIEAEKGRYLEWSEAVEEWMELYYDSFIAAIVPSERAKRTIEVMLSSFVDRSGGLVKDIYKALFHESYQGCFTNKK